MLEKVKFDGKHASTMFAKNLFLNNKKKKEQVFLVVAAHDTTVDMKGLEKHLATGSGNLRAADPAVMEQLIGVKQGSVNLFAILNDTAKKVKLIVDQRLTFHDFHFVGFHPMQNDATTAITPADMMKVIELSDHQPEIIDFSKLIAASAAPKDDATPK